MSIVTWHLKEGDVIEVYYRTADKYKMHKVIRILDDGLDFVNPIHVIIDTGHLVTFNENHQTWIFLG